MALHQTLKAIHADMKDPENWSGTGISARVVYYGSRQEMREFLVVAEKWPKHSGDHWFPIPGSSKKVVKNSRDRMWNRKSSTYAELRWQLLEFAIKHTEGTK